jgi:hypothetical protein
MMADGLRCAELGSMSDWIESMHEDAQSVERALEKFYDISCGAVWVRLEFERWACWHTRVVEVNADEVVERVVDDAPPEEYEDVRKTLNRDLARVDAWLEAHPGAVIRGTEAWDGAVDWAIKLNATGSKI